MLNKIKVAVVDDHQIFRLGLVTSLERFEEIDVIHDFASAEEFLDFANHAKSLPDIVLSDMKMTGMDGAQMISKALERHHELKFIGLSVYESHLHVVSMFKAGARGYLLKDSTPTEIAEAIKTVYEQGYFFNQTISLKLLKSILDKDVIKNFKGKTMDDLGEQEVSILKLICDEKTNTEIADTLNLGVKTVENYRNKLLQKTGARNTAGLVIYAVKKGFIVA